MTAHARSRHPGLPTSITPDTLNAVVGQQLTLTWAPFTDNDDIDSWVETLQVINDLGDTDAYRLSAAIVTAVISSLTSAPAKRTRTVSQIDLIADSLLFIGRCFPRALEQTAPGETAIFENPQRIYTQLCTAHSTLLTWLTDNRTAHRKHLAVDGVELGGDDDAPDVYLAFTLDVLHHLADLVIDVVASSHNTVLLRTPLDAAITLDNPLTHRVTGYGLPDGTDTGDIARLALELFDSDDTTTLPAAFDVARRLTPHTTNTP
jgi:hypothetical protein